MTSVEYWLRFVGWQITVMAAVYVSGRLWRML